MRLFQIFALGVALLAAPFAFAEEISHDVVILGEIHDNPAHHTVQARYLETLAPQVVVFEMLTPQEAAQLADVARAPDAMRQAVAGFHWSNIEDYAAVLAASPVIRAAALSREDIVQAFSEGAAAVFGSDANDFGLTEPLPEDQQATREDLQFTAHCEAMPREMMGGMVEAQRLRDAGFARAVLDAFDEYGAPVVLITGNGHARDDWGVPQVLRRVRPELSVLTIGQGEDGVAPDGGFGRVLFSPSIERPNPCDAFK
jgi:uncharacterized iron-regulated protein